MLAAGDGGRLGALTERLPKPLLPINGRALANYTLEALASARIEEVVVVTGYRQSQVVAALTCDAPAALQLTFVSNPRFHGHASLSLRAAREHCGDEPFLLVMSDHLLSTALVARLLAAEPAAMAAVAADFGQRDPAYIKEATKLSIRPGAANRVAAIGKSLASWDALDAGAFVIQRGAWQTIEAAPEDCELSVIFSSLAAASELTAIDITGDFWYDIDTAEDLAGATTGLALIDADG